MSRQPIFFSPCPGVGLRGVDLGPDWLFPWRRKILYRDQFGCHTLSGLLSISRKSEYYVPARERTPKPERLRP